MELVISCKITIIRNQHDSYTNSASDNEINSKEIHLEDIIYTVVTLTYTH